jgi:pimeloyl-ACP methyl ester carboxylesterase
LTLAPFILRAIIRSQSRYAGPRAAGGLPLRSRIHVIDDATTPRILRRIVAVEGRRIHLRHAGSGPRLLLIHGSPASSEFLLPVIAQLAPHYSCLAPDTPGFGESDPLPGGARTIAAAAAATAELLDALRFGPCLVLGTHTGAAIALELAVQRPDLVGGLLLDGVALFDAAEEHLFDGYFEPVLVDDRGGHFARTWTRIRDMFIWFPWTSHAPERLNGTDLPPVTSTHRWVSMLFQAAPNYAEIYRAAIAYTERALEAAAAQTRPAVYLAHDRDMLAPHLSRLPPLKPVDRIEVVSSAPGMWAAAVERGLAGLLHSVTVAAGALQPPLVEPRADAAADRFVELPHGQMRLRRFGNPGAPPLLLLHDAPGSGVTLRALAAALTAAWCVWVPDLPGCGASQPLAAAEPTLEDYAAALEPLLSTLSSAAVAVYGCGCGAALALQIACRYPTRCRHLLLDELLLADADAPLPDARFCAQITLAADGSHWFGTWQRLRDSQIFWPWYDTSARGLLRLPGNFGGEFLHEWTAQVLQQHATAHCLPRAVVAADVRGMLAAASPPLTVMVRRGHPLLAPALRVQRALPRLAVVAYEGADRAAELDRLLRDHIAGDDAPLDKAPLHEPQE